MEEYIPLKKFYVYTIPELVTLLLNTRRARYIFFMSGILDRGLLKFSHPDQPENQKKYDSTDRNLLPLQSKPSIISNTKPETVLYYVFRQNILQENS